MSTINEEMIKDKLTKTCTCKVVTRGAIKTAIANGADTVEKVKVATGAMTGCCKGRRCQARIEELLEQYSNN